MLSLALGGFSCDKKTVAPAPDPGPSVPFETPRPVGAPPPASTDAGTAAAPTPAEGTRFGELAEKLPSPCGKAESLKRTIEADPGCKSAPFARRFVEKLVRLDAGDDEINHLYRERFGERANPTFTLRETAFSGTPNAPVQVVEFFDYACPHCREAMPILERLVTDYPKDVVVYYKMYPLRKETTDAARAAVAAQKQGKFKEMSQKLFENANRLSREDVIGYAKELGLDVARFEKDLNDPATSARIEADKEEGRKAGLEGTPLIFVNGRKYHNGFAFDPPSDWVEEELALNR